MTDPQPAFRALADPTRRGILAMLARTEMTIGEVTEALPMTRAAVKKHLTILEQGRLIEVEARGRERVNRLRPGALQPVANWIARIDAAWDGRLADLKSAIERDTP